jgi:hypothetical protein
VDVIKVFDGLNEVCGYGVVREVSAVAADDSLPNRRGAGEEVVEEVDKRQGCESAAGDGGSPCGVTRVLPKDHAIRG